MGYGERDTFEATKTKFANICEENGLTYKIINKEYPFAVAVSPDQAMEAQTTMLDNETGYNGKDAKWIFIFPDGVLENKTIDDFTLPDTLLNKLRNYSKKIYEQWCKIVYRENIENRKFADASEPDHEAGADGVTAEQEYAEL